MEISLSLSLTGRLLSSAFSPALLFALAEPGVWYDPSDVANLNWRRNLLTWTEQFDNAAWVKASVTVSANAGTAPDGTMTADKAVATNTASTTRAVYQNFTAPSTTTYTFSAYVKAAEYSRFALQELASGRFGATFDLSAQTTASLGGAGFVSSSITSVGNGWFRCSVVWNGVASTGYAISAIGYPAGASVVAAGTSYAGDGTSGILIWGAQLELGSTVTDYQRISDVNTEVVERFPTATLFTDTAGTTPVTTPGQTVALALDKSKGLVLGSELVTNGDFSSGTTGWTTTAQSPATLSSSVVSGAARLVYNHSGSLSGQFSQGISVVAGRTYRITATATVVSGTANANISVRSTNDAATSTNLGFQTISTSGSTNVSFVYTAASTTTVFLSAYFFTSSSTVDVDNISVKELPGNHATQATAASRPTYGIVPLGGRRNLLTFTEQFDNAAWTKNNTNAVSNSSVAPDAATTADTVRLNAGASLTVAAGGLFTNSAVYVSQPTSSALAATGYTYSVYVKSGSGISHVQLRVGTTAGMNPSVADTIIRLSDGVVVAGTGVVANAGNGWWRVSLPFTATAAVHHCGLWFWNSSSIASAAGTEGILIWGAQLETGSTATAYQRVGSAFDVTEAGVASLSYLSFDGVDDFLVTPTITPGVDKAQVFAGVRKLSDAAVATIAEHSINSGSTAGSWGLFASGYSAGGAAYAANLFGSQRSSFDATTFTSPTTNVLSATFDIAQATRAAEIGFKVNGSVPTLTGGGFGDAGTGNFTAQAIYIGRRNGTVFPLNGNLFSLIVRFGTNLDAGTITSTETWVNGKTGAYT